MDTRVEYTYFLDAKEEDQLRATFTKEKGKIIAFRIQYETKIANKWTPVIRYDTAHKAKYPYGHQDELHPNPKKNKKIDLQDVGISTLGEALTYADKDLKSNWRSYKKRYLNWLKQHD